MFGTLVWGGGALLKRVLHIFVNESMSKIGIWVILMLRW